MREINTGQEGKSGQKQLPSPFVFFFFFFSLRFIIAMENTPISLALEEKSLTGTGIFLQINSHITSMLYLSWAEIGTTGARSAIVPAGKERKKKPKNICYWVNEQRNNRMSGKDKLPQTSGKKGPWLIIDQHPISVRLILGVFIGFLGWQFLSYNSLWPSLNLLKMQSFIIIGNWQTLCFYWVIIFCCFISIVVIAFIFGSVEV